MYFKNINNTNIDDELNSYNILSKIKNIILKYKLFIIIGIFFIIFIMMILLFYNKKVENYLLLHGEETITIYEDSDYVEPGFDAYNSKNEKLINEVKINSNLNTKEKGTYEIIYTLGNIIRTRKINVIEKAKNYTYIYLNPINNDVNIYLPLGSEYIEPGFKVYSNSNADLTNKVEVTGTVDINKKGSYQLTYTVVDTTGVTVSKKRTIHIMDSIINLKLSNKELTNKDITINIKIDDELFDYMIIPDGNKINDSIYTYKVSTNGVYTFKVYNKKGIEKEKNIKITNIDKEEPTGSCIGSYQNGKSIINVNANDNNTINYYEMNSQKYSDSKISINEEIKTANIKIYDKAGNIKNISCNLEDKNDKIFDKNITYSSEYVYKSNGVSYVLYTPSTANTYEEIPLIIWLHGSGSRGKPAKKFSNNELMGRVIRNWNFDNFNAYILSPHISKETTSSWGSGNIKEKFYVIFEEILKTKNIDKNKIVLAGHSMGGIGVYDIAKDKAHLFSAFVVMSGYNTNTDLVQYQNKPIKGYVGTIEKGEDESSYKHMTTKFVKYFGQDNLTIIKTSHGSLPEKALNIDNNNDNKSDLIEWMLTQKNSN